MASVIVQEQSVVLQTTDYTDFDAFLGRLALAMEIVNEVVGNLVVVRIGLRFIDLIRTGKGESWKKYVKEGCHGLESKVVPNESVLFFQSVTQTGGSEPHDRPPRPEPGRNGAAPRSRYDIRRPSASPPRLANS